jgi:hypothetical protein
MIDGAAKFGGAQDRKIDVSRKESLAVTAA